MDGTQRRRSLLRLILALVASTCFVAMYDLDLPSYLYGDMDDADETSFLRRRLDNYDREQSESSPQRRYLTTKYNKGSPRNLVDDDNERNDKEFESYSFLADTAASLPDPTPATTNDDSVARWSDVQPYTLQDVLSESTIWDYTFCTLLYSPSEDAFLAFYNKNHKWKAGNKKLWKAVRSFVFMLKEVFPDRFTPANDEWAVAFGSGDYPHVHKAKLPYTEGKAPVLMFGSAFLDRATYPNLMAMPMPEHLHLDCFAEWTRDERLCDALGRDVEYGESNGMEFDDLIPQLVWRGTDFGYLPTLNSKDPATRLVTPHPSDFVRPPEVNAPGNRRKSAVEALMAKYSTLLPRWKAVALAAHAEVHDQQIEYADRPGLPWADIRFSAFLGSGGKTPTVRSEKYALWESVGMATGVGMSPRQLATYKYHVDLGGGGGTTWSGTLDKLAMPGLLFHHVTPTKDYIHDRLRPWKHYVPVDAELSDLKAKYDWAEANPDRAKRISAAGTAFVKQLGTKEGFEEVYREDFVEPLRRAIEAYTPISKTHPALKGTSVLEALRALDADDRFVHAVTCSGKRMVLSCSIEQTAEVEAFQRNGRWVDLGEEEEGPPVINALAPAGSSGPWILGEW